MQCSSYSPMYYHARDLTSGANGHSWHLYDTNGEGRGFNVPMPQCDQYSVYDREVMKQIIHNHEATFRHQVRELHRLYRRQRDLMEEMRVREIVSQHFQSRTSESIHSSSHAGDEFSQKPSPATDWLLGNHLTSSRNAQWPRSFVAESFQKLPTLGNDSFVRRNSEHDAKFLSSSSKRKGDNIIDLEFPADVYGDDQVKQFKGTNLSEASESPEKFSDFQPSRTWDLSSSSSDIKKSSCCIDLNEPIQLEAFTGYNETVYRDECASVEATPESIVLTHSKLVKSGESSDGVNSSMAIDLNSMPSNCFSDIERNLESPPSINREAKAVLDCSYEDRSTVQSDNSGSFSKTECYIDLNTDVADNSLPQSSSTLEIKSVEYAELEGPVSPDNEERSPPRGKSEDIQLETPLSSEGEREPFVELETTAAQALVMILSSGNLSWFAEIVSSNIDELENAAMKLKIEADEDYQGDENGLSSSRSNKGNVSRRSVKGQKKGKKQHKDLKTAPPKRKAGKSPCAKPRKYSKLSPSDVTKKPVSSILKQSDGVVQRWGKTRKREGGRRRRVTEFFIMT